MAKRNKPFRSELILLPLSPQFDSVENQRTQNQKRGAEKHENPKK
jgi:hypothetical protein